MTNPDQAPEKDVSIILKRNTAPGADVHYVPYGEEKESPYLPAIRQLISKDLSEPYSIYVYRYFLYQWGDLCIMALDNQDTSKLIGVIVCKLEPHRDGPLRGYIAMLATRAEHRGKGIATKLVRMAIDRMIEKDADEIALETEVDNIPSLRIYENLGFLRTKRLHRYYLNGNTAFRLVLYLKPGIPQVPAYLSGHSSVLPRETDVLGARIDAERDPTVTTGSVERHTAQERIEDVQGEKFDVTGRANL